MSVPQTVYLKEELVNAPVVVLEDLTHKQIVAEDVGFVVQ